jgi:hypothetical protein
MTNVGLKLQTTRRTQSSLIHPKMVRVSHRWWCRRPWSHGLPRSLWRSGIWPADKRLRLAYRATVPR